MSWRITKVEPVEEWLFLEWQCISYNVKNTDFDYSRCSKNNMPIFAVVCIFGIYFSVFVLLPCWQIKMNITSNISLMLQTVECYENSL